jgi:hypothetical protein
MLTINTIYFSSEEEEKIKSLLLVGYLSTALDHKVDPCCPHVPNSLPLPACKTFLVILNIKISKGSVVL